MVDLDDLSVYGYELERLLKIKHQCDEICAWFLNEKEVYVCVLRMYVCRNP